MWTTLHRQPRAPGHWAVVVAFIAVVLPAALLVAFPPVQVTVTVEEQSGAPGSGRSVEERTQHHRAPVEPGLLAWLFGPPLLLTAVPQATRGRRSMLAARGLSTVGLAAWGFVWIFSFGLLLVPAVFFMAVAFAHPLVIRPPRRG